MKQRIVHYHGGKVVAVFGIIPCFACLAFITHPLIIFLFLAPAGGCNLIFIIRGGGLSARLTKKGIAPRIIIPYLFKDDNYNDEEELVYREQRDVSN